MKVYLRTNIDLDTEEHWQEGDKMMRRVTVAHKGFQWKNEPPQCVFILRDHTRIHYPTAASAWRLATVILNHGTLVDLKLGARFEATWQI